MAAKSELLDRLNAKPLRALRLIDELELAITTFHAIAPYRIEHKDNLGTQERTFYVSFTEQMPFEFAAIVGDILHDLRSSLDHIAYYLVCVGQASQGPFPHVYFPIFESAQKYHANKLEKTKGMRPDALKAIDSVEPYSGGNGTVLWHLHKMNNVDKHRLLLPVWASLAAHSLPRSQKKHFTKILQATYPGGIPFDFTHAANGPVLLKDGAPILTLPIAEVQEPMRFQFQIAFGEPDVVKGKAVIPTLKYIADFTLNLIEDFNKAGVI
jgi:hypothetical protein